ncbi:unnamed protein product [Caenorhabditis bovis]|uniref:SKP1 component dimerisation domain-containing protein n=1 Tax=Caenorhabditis bovis TaxID=2654633 RepID=A0A8S1F431_9PELO|nr:unnamed protein product [Caenorhabditis bovis]
MSKVNVLVETSDGITIPILRWYYHTEEPQPEPPEDAPAAPDNPRKDEIDEWYLRFFGEMGQGLMFDTLKAADYLDIPELLDIACKCVALMLKMRTHKDVCEMFGITDPGITDQRYIYLYNKYSWCSD